jgi:hypothetical protein
MTSPYGPPQESPLNAPAGAVTPIGVQPGVSPGVVFASIIIVTGGAGSGVFIYSPSPGAGNLIGSWAGSAGTDPYGNAYPKGLSVTVGTISGSAITASSFSGTDFIISPTGMLFYSGTPAAGNLITAIAPTAGSDQFGNTYPAGVGIGNAGELLAGNNVILNSKGLFVYGSPAQVTVQETSGSGTIAIPTGVTTVKAECWAGGSAGFSGSGGLLEPGTGGFGGEYAAEPALAVTHAAGVAYVVGAGGASVAGNSGGFNAGGNSTLQGTSVQVLANGGNYNQSYSSNTIEFQGGQGGTGYVGANYSAGGGGGGSGGSSSAGNNGSSATSGPPPVGGTGATAVSGGGAGSNGAAYPAAGANGIAPGGAGGGGAYNINLGVGTASGAGAHGLVQVTYTPATVALVMSFAPSSGTDGFGNAFPAGMYIADPIVMANISAPSATASAATLYAISGSLKYISGLTGDGSAYNTGRLTVTSPGQTITGTGITNLTGCSAPVGIGTYQFHASILFQGSAAAGTAIFSFASPPSTSTCTLPGTITNVGSPGTISVTFGAFAGGFNINALSQTVTSPTLSNTQNFLLVFDGIITFTAAGTLQMACKCGTNGDNVIVSNGSYMELMPVA